MYANIYEVNGPCLWVGNIATEIRTGEFIQLMNKTYKVEKILHQLPSYTFSSKTSQPYTVPMKDNQGIVIFVKECPLDDVLSENNTDENI